MEAAVIGQQNSTAVFLTGLNLKENAPLNLILNDEIKESKSRLIKSSLPNKKDEAWKYSKISPWLKKNYSSFRSNDKIDLKQFKSVELKANLLVFVNGFYRDDLSKISHQQSGVIIQNMTEAIDLFQKDIESHFSKELEPSFFNDLNTLYHGNGVFIKVNKDVIVETPIHLLHIQTGTGNIAQARNLVILEENSQIDILESQFEFNAIDCISNHVSEYFIGKNALLNYSLIEKGSKNALIHTNFFVQEDFSKLNSNVFSLEKCHPCF